MKQTESQNKKIINYLLKGKKITALDALKKFDCLRLASRIFQLKNLGYPIQSKFIETKYSKKRVKQYFIKCEN